VAAEPRGITPVIRSGPAAMMAARPAASIRVIRPLECSEPITFASAGGASIATTPTPSFAETTERPVVACAGIGVSRSRATSVPFIPALSAVAVTGGRPGNDLSEK